MIEEFAYKGQWFLIENPENKISGLLKFDTKSDPVLELYGTFNGISRGVNLAEFILGITTTGEFITLYDSVEIQRSNTNGNQTSTYSTFYVFIGSHYYSPEAFIFNRVTAKFKNIDKWVNKFGFRINNDYANDAFNVTYRKPKDISFNINDELNGRLYFNFYNPWSENTDKVNLRQYVFFELQFSKPTTFRQMMDYLMLFQNFLTLACFEPAYPLSISTSTHNNEGNEVLSQLVYKPGFNYIKPELGRGRFLFFYTDIEKNFGQIIQKWYNLKDNLEPVSNLLFSSFYDREKNVVNEFLNITQALETYHRKFKDIKPFKEADFIEWKESLLSTVVQKEYKEMLEGKLKYGNEQSLRKRLSLLIDNLGVEMITKMIVKKKDFVNTTLDCRNYYTHYDDSLKEKVLSGSELSYLTQKLKVILIGTVLLETGFTLSEIEDILKRSGTYHFHHLIKES